MTRTIGALIGALFIIGCDDGPDLISVVSPPDAGAVSGCVINPPPVDANCACPDSGEIVVIPGCGIICGLE